MSKELWKPVKGYENLYSISNHGRVKRLARNTVNINGISRELHEMILKNFKGELGYIHVNLWKDGEIKQHKIHRIIMIAFVEKPNDKNIVNHIDGDKTNNLLENLEWCDYKENSVHAYSTGLSKGQKGVENSQCRLTNNDVMNIRKLYATGNFTQKEIGLQFGISREHARDIINGKRWSWLTEQDVANLA